VSKYFLYEVMKKTTLWIGCSIILFLVILPSTISNSYSQVNEIDSLESNSKINYEIGVYLLNGNFHRMMA